MKTAVGYDSEFLNSITYHNDYYDMLRFVILIT